MASWMLLSVEEEESEEDCFLSGAFFDSRELPYTYLDFVLS